MSTTLTVTLSDQLQQTLSSTTNGQVGVWAVYFPGSDVTAIPLAVQGGGNAAAPTTITLPMPWDGGKVYFLVQSVATGTPLLTFGPGGDIQAEGDINWQSASTNQFRYDSFEVSLLGQPADAGNLTDVNSFGFPMSVAIAYPNGTAEQTRGYAVSGSTMFTSIDNAFATALTENFTAGPLAGTPREVPGPATVLSTPGLTGVSAADFYGYVESIGNLAAGQLHIAGQFNGAASVEYVVGQTNITYSNWHNPAFYAYTASYEVAPLTVHQGSSTLGANPFSTMSQSAAITVTDPNASQYVVGQTMVSFSGATAVGGYTADQLNQTFQVANVTDSSHYVVIAPGNALATTTATGGGSAVQSAIPLGVDPFSATEGQSYFTVTDPDAAAYANTGVQVTFSGASSFSAFPTIDLDTTTFTITKVVSATQYQVATTSAAVATATGGGSTVAPTYVRPDAGTFVFTPDDNSQVQGNITISSQDLANSIYSTLGNAQIQNPDGSYYNFTALNSSNVGISTTDVNTGANDQWGAMFVKLLTGLMGGYVGGEGTPLNSLLGPQTLNFSQNWNFDPSYAFRANVTTPWTWNTATYGVGAMYDAYAQLFFDSTNSYGNGYSDALMSQFQQGGPLIPSGYTLALGDNPFSTINGSATVTVTDPNASSYSVGDLVSFANASVVAGIDMTKAPEIAPNFYAFTIASIGTGTYTVVVQGTTANATTTGGGDNVLAGLDVGNIAITIYDDNETPPAGQTLAQEQQYTPTEIYNTYDSSLGSLVAPLATGHSSDLAMQFGLGLGQMRPSDDLTVKLGFYTGTTSGVATFSYVTFGTSSTESLFQTWDYDDSNGTLTAAGNPAASGVSLQINDLPYATGVNWYQLVFENSDATVSRAYNIYLDADQSSGVVNPAYTGNSPGAIAIDGLATYVRTDTTDEYLKSLVFNMFSGGTLSMDPSMLEQITDPTVMAGNSLWPTPAAPVLGTLSSSAFTNWGGSAASATPNDSAELAAVNQAVLAFGWYASDQTWLANDAETVNTPGATNYSGVIGAYTNKIGALNVARVEFQSGTGLTTRAPITAVADADGEWTTGAGQFGNGTYSAVFDEFAPDDTEFSTPLATQSQLLSFTVDVPTLALSGNGTSTIGVLPDSLGTGGNWLSLNVTGSTFRNGTLLAYATDAGGNLIGRDGQVGASLADSVLAQIGLVSTDGGSVMFRGAQSVYLPVGLQLHFALEQGDGTVKQFPDVSVSGGSTLSVLINGNGGTLNLTAEADNDLTDEAILAGSQRASNQPFVHLEQGQDIGFSVQGSAFNNNTVHFVRMDVDPGTGALSVGGVAYGNTDAFRQAVQDNWDDNFTVSGGRGNFSRSGTWDVSSGTGYYAPVLQTEGGDIFMAGTANIDGQNHVRMFGQNMFGFEDLRGNQSSDFDYNDLVVKLIPG